MLGDPLSIGTGFITANGIPAISRETNKSVYRKTVGDVTFTATISHAYANGRRRSMVRLDANTISADPFDSTSSVADTTATYLVIDRNERLVSDAAVVSYIMELLGVLAVTNHADLSYTRVQSIVGGES